MGRVDASWELALSNTYVDQLYSDDRKCDEKPEKPSMEDVTRITTKPTARSPLKRLEDAPVVRIAECIKRNPAPRRKTSGYHQEHNGGHGNA